MEHLSLIVTSEENCVESPSDFWFSVIKALNTIKLFYCRSQEATRPTQ